MNAATTQTGIPIIDCKECQTRHPVGRNHCFLCGSPSLFVNGMGYCVGCAA